jgi:hypothetical protein
MARPSPRSTTCGGGDCLHHALPEVGDHVHEPTNLPVEVAILAAA